MEKAFLKKIVEAIIIANDEPISENRIASLVDGLTPGQVKKMIEQLNKEYEKADRSFFIANVAGGYQVTTNKELSPWIKKLYKGKIKTRLSQASLESLAIIVFRQPISRVEIDAIRGVNSGGVVKNLLERNLITIAGRAKGPGKPLLYGTTKEFLQYLGINDISELPRLKEIEEIMGKLDSEQGLPDNVIEALTAAEGSEAQLEIDVDANGHSENGEQNGSTGKSSDTAENNDQT